MKNQYKGVLIGLIGLVGCSLTLSFVIDRYQMLDFVEANCIIINGTLIYESKPEAHYNLLLNVSIFNRTLDTYNYVCSTRYYCEQWLEENINRRNDCLYSKYNDEAIISSISNPYLAVSIVIGFFGILVLIFLVFILTNVFKDL